MTSVKHNLLIYILWALIFHRLPDDFFDNGMKPAPLKGILKKPQLAGDYDSSSEEEEENGDMERSAAPAPSSGVNRSNSTAATPIGSTNKGTINSSLPSGMR